MFILEKHERLFLKNKSYEILSFFMLRRSDLKSNLLLDKSENFGISSGIIFVLGSEFSILIFYTSKFFFNPWVKKEKDQQESMLEIKCWIKTEAIFLLLSRKENV